MPRYLRGELPERTRTQVDDHLSVCDPCRSELQFERDLDARLSNPGDVPGPLFEKARLRVLEGNPDSRPEPIQRRKPMKRLLVSGAAVAALCVVAFGLYPTGAKAATARDTFRQMKAAMATAKKDRVVTVEAVAMADGQVQLTVTEDGKPIETNANVDVKTERKGNEVVLTLSMSFEELDYSKIDFGKNRDTLVLYPKKQAKEKVEVSLDHKSKRPLGWTTFAKNDKSWKKVGAFRFKYAPT
jgi:hypothetical protein